MYEDVWPLITRSVEASTVRLKQVFSWQHLAKHGRRFRTILVQGHQRGGVEPLSAVDILVWVKYDGRVQDQTGNFCKACTHSFSYRKNRRCSPKETSFGTWQMGLIENWPPTFCWFCLSVFTSAFSRVTSAAADLISSKVSLLPSIDRKWCLKICNLQLISFAFISKWSPIKVYFFLAREIGC